MAFTVRSQQPDNITFRAIEPGGGTGDEVTFKAFIDNISDTFSPGWQEYLDMARADAKVMYKQFARQIDIQFKVVADGVSTSASSIAFKKLNDLALITYPVYNGDYGHSGRYVNFTIGNIWKSCIGYILSLRYNWDEETPWIGELPIYTQVDISIMWIGNMRPDARSKLAYGTA